MTWFTVCFCGQGFTGYVCPGCGRTPIPTIIRAPR